MKKFIIVLFACLIGATSVFSQTKGQIEIQKRRYYVNGEPLVGKELQTLLKSEPESSVMYQKASQNLTIGGVFLGLGTVAVLYAAINPPKEDGKLPGTISDEEMSKWMVPIYISGACIAVSIPFLFTGKSQFKKAINLYNSKQTTGFNSNQKLELGLTQHGIGIVYKF